MSCWACGGGADLAPGRSWTCPACEQTYHEPSPPPRLRRVARVRRQLELGAERFVAERLEAAVERFLEAEGGAS